MIICSKFTHVFQKKICYLWQVGQMTCGPNFFSQNSNNYGNYSKIYFFQEKNNWEFAALKNLFISNRIYEPVRVRLQ